MLQKKQIRVIVCHSAPLSVHSKSGECKRHLFYCPALGHRPVSENKNETDFNSNSTQRVKVWASPPSLPGDSSTDATSSLGKPGARAAVRPSPGERLVLYKDAALRVPKTSALLSLCPGRSPGEDLAGVWSKGDAMKAQGLSETKPAPETEQQRFRPIRIARRQPR